MSKKKGSRLVGDWRRWLEMGRYVFRGRGSSRIELRAVDIITRWKRSKRLMRLTAGKKAGKKGAIENVKNLNNKGEK